MTSKTILVLGDSHAHRNYDNDRFEEFGKFARVLGADRVHSTGDWTDFPSLNMHKSKREMRKDLYLEDVAAGNNALARFDMGLDGHSCEKTISLGNHDVYPNRYIEENDPKLEGLVDWSDVHFQDYGWRAWGFKDTEEVEGFLCSHHFPTGTGSDRAQAGLHIAYNNAVKRGDSCIFGHSHRFQHYPVVYPESGRRIHAFNAGCTVHPSYREAWCKSTRDHWAVGVLVIRTRDEKLQEFTWVEYEEMKRYL